jgi:hypothetical protein
MVYTIIIIMNLSNVYRTKIHMYFYSRYIGVYMTLVKEYDFWILVVLVICTSLVLDFIVRTLQSYCALFSVSTKYQITIRGLNSP